MNGVSARAVDDLVVALGGTGISKSELSRICQALDAVVGRFRTRRLDGCEYPHVFLDATYLHVRAPGAPELGPLHRTPTERHHAR